MGTTPPKDFLACDGEIYNIANYQQLANHINRQFGSYNFFGGDGTTTFAVPDLRGEFLRGTGTNSHTNQGNGENVGVHQDATEENASVCGTDNVLNYKGTQKGVLKEDSILHTTSTYLIGPNSTYNIGSSKTDRYTSRPTNTSVLYCIKYKSSNDITNATSLDETLLYSGNDPITATTGSTTYTLSDDITKFDYILIEVEGNQQNATNPSTTRMCSSQELEGKIINYSCSIGEHRGDNYTTYFDGWVTCATSEEANTTTIRFALMDKTSNINSVILKSVVGIKKKSLSTADIAEMAAPSSVFITLEPNTSSNDKFYTATANGFVFASCDKWVQVWNDFDALIGSSSGYYGGSVGTARILVPVKKGAIVNYYGGATTTAKFIYSIGDAKALGLL